MINIIIKKDYNKIIKKLHNYNEFIAKIVYMDKQINRFFQKEII